MPRKVNKLIVDTNLWISFLIKKDFKQLDEQIKKEKLIIVFSDELMEEFVTVANRSKFRKYFQKADIVKLLELFEVYGKIIRVKSTVAICRDKKDNFLLSLAKDSHADFLVTGDEDLLALRQFESTLIITIADFLKRGT
jgi:uncharacterized protein